MEAKVPQLSTMLAKLHYGMASLYLIHCFDNRPLWFQIWTAICVRGILIARIPLAGASAEGKHYKKFFDEKRADKNAPVVIATHYPCGWFEGQDQSHIMKHGDQVVDFLREAGMKPIHLHFGLIKGKLAVRIYDPLKLAETSELVGRVLSAVSVFNGTTHEDEATEYVPTPRIVLAKEVFGPPIGEGLLVVHDKFVVSDTFFIAWKLNGGNAIQLDCVEQVYVPNYATAV